MSKKQKSKRRLIARLSVVFLFLFMILSPQPHLLMLHQRQLQPK